MKYAGVVKVLQPKADLNSDLPDLGFQEGTLAFDTVGEVAIAAVLHDQV
jgi:hypothetical protein